MNQVNAHKYNITIRLGEFEGEECYQATVKEIPSLSEYADTYEEAYALITDAIETLSEMYAEQGKVFPEPQTVTSTEYSGRVTLRLPRSLHETIAESAENEGISLNSLISNVLAAYTGFGMGFKKTIENWHDLQSTPTHNSMRVAEIIEFQEYKQVANG